MTIDLDNLGYYMVGNEKINHKPTALVRATQTRLHPSWHFHNEIFSKLDWQSDSVADMNQL